MDAAQWPQGRRIGIGVECSRNILEKKGRPQQKEALNCPRCNSINTKFCYYNNYSLSQPRYFCKTCTRYWTEGGTLRNVPVGGTSRKNKRSSSSSSSSIISVKKLIIPDLSPRPPKFSPHQLQNPKIHDDGQLLNLSYNIDPNSELALPFALEVEADDLNPQNPNYSGGQLTSLNISNSNSPSFPMHQLYFKPSLSLNFSLDGVNENQFRNLQSTLEGDDPAASRILFPFEESRRPLPVANDQSNGYWSGMLSGGSW
ncbi:hypothetical protein C2S52_015774 [Perilla frutescens var. hirtella]|nr:hypothetical protein C2S52_015774 [Perilla frutescens var. hirtella]